MATLKEEISRRRTFAIISHPDAGKTTLTEKFLLYGGAIAQAGAVKGKKNSRAAVSDWMEIEKQRGISVTSSVMQFQYEGYCINILDTPGHQDFSEDTYRTLMAADSAVMVIDGAKGVEPQTRKLFKVCAMRHIPIFTFINKMDRESRDPFDLLDELFQLLCTAALDLFHQFELHIDGHKEGLIQRLLPRKLSREHRNTDSPVSGELSDPRCDLILSRNLQRLSHRRADTGIALDLQTAVKLIVHLFQRFLKFHCRKLLLAPDQQHH